MAKNTFRTWTVAALCGIASAAFGQAASYSTQAITKDLAYFNDWTASGLADGFKKKHLKNFSSPLMRELARQLSQGTYRPAYLLNSYKPVASNKVLKE